MISTPPNAGLYTVLVVDIPWSYGKKTNARTARYRTSLAQQQYQVQGQGGSGEINRRTGAGIETVIAAVPIKDWSADNAHLYLWVTNPKLPFAFQVMREWGFEYKTLITWVKTRKSTKKILQECLELWMEKGPYAAIMHFIHKGGQGWFFKGATEHVLFGVRGRKPIEAAIREPNVIFADKTGGHSAKPDTFYHLVERVSGPGPRIDVYARKRRPGWDAWGDEVE